MDRELLLLGLISRTQMYGYQIHEFIERNLATCTDLKKPTAYFLLDKLVKQGWLTQTKEQKGQRPPRQIYQITAAGEAHFQRLLRDNLGHYAVTRFSGDIGLAFANLLPAAEVVTLLHQRRASMSAALAAVHAAPQHERPFQLIVDHYNVHLEAELIWLDQVIAHFMATDSGDNASSDGGEPLLE